MFTARHTVQRQFGRPSIGGSRSGRRSRPHRRQEQGHAGRPDLSEQQIVAHPWPTHTLDCFPQFVECDRPPLFRLSESSLVPVAALVDAVAVGGFTRWRRCSAGLSWRLWLAPGGVDAFTAHGTAGGVANSMYQRRSALRCQ
jgi:hypothetical protein